jgi:serine O-acetyltransferase
METSLTKEALAGYLAKQLNNIFPDDREIEPTLLSSFMDRILERTAYCFSKVDNRYFVDNGKTVFNHLHADQYAIFLYFAANTLFRAGVNAHICEKIFQLNRCLHGLDAFYEVNLPDVFLVVHPLGTVLGRGEYSDYFLVYQRCGVGSNRDVYPRLGEFVTLRPGSSVLGACRIGRNSTLGAESLLLDRDLPDETLYIGTPRNFATKKDHRIPSIWRRSE